MIYPNQPISLSNIEIHKSKDYELGYCWTTLVMKTSFSDTHIPKDDMETMPYRLEMVLEIRSPCDFFKVCLTLALSKYLAFTSNQISEFINDDKKFSVAELCI